MQADLKETNRLLSRIADALEQVVLQQYGVYVGETAKPAPDPNPKDQPTVRYATDEEMVRHNLIELMRGVKGAVEEVEIETDRDDWTRS